MSRHICVFIIAIVGLWIPCLCIAFDTETHAAITRQAYSNFLAANQPAFFAEYGLNRLNPDTPFNLYWQTDPNLAFPYYYTDGTGASGAQPMYPEAYERCQMQGFLYPQIPSMEGGDYQIFSDTVSNIFALPYSGYSSTFDNVLPIQNWIVRGAIREDDIGKQFSPFEAPNANHCKAEFLLSTWGDYVRSFRHFYNPSTNQALTVHGVSPCLSYEFTPCAKAVDWALGLVDSFAPQPQLNNARLNFYSYEDARNTLWWALTCERGQQANYNQPCQKNGPPIVFYSAVQRHADAADRMALWATTFRSLGDVLHLLEDMGQPQHTRNDFHGTSLASEEQKAFEDYTNDRVLGVTDEVNPYVRGFFSQLPVSFSAPPLGTYPAPMFTTPVRFFSTQNVGSQSTWLGLADYTNRGFFTGGTLPETTSEPSPPHPLDTSYGITVVPCEGLLGADIRLQSVTCTHYTHAVPDVFDPNYADVLPAGYTQPPLVSESVFRQILTAVQVNAGQTSTIDQSAIGIAELDTIGNLTIPRAVGYAAGMLNYFFRGTLQVTAPASGVYAIVNHGTPHGVNSDGVPYLTSNPNQVFGFTQVRLQVKNTTPPINDPGMSTPVSQDAGGPGAKMVAIARYHRNPCYQPDLSGEVSMDSANQVHQPSCQSFRTAYPEISVSAEVPVSLGMLEGQPIEQQFDFTNDPIPINATDLFIQVAYRGPLGDEADGIAVGSIDVSEPSYENYLAMTDIPLQYQEDGSTWKWGAWTSPPWSTWISPVDGRTITHPEPDPVADLALTHVEICDNGFQIYTSTSTEQLPEDHVVRIAVLRDFTSRTVKMQDTSQGQFASPSTVNIYTRNGGDINQAQNEQGDGSFTTYRFYGRGLVLGDTKSYTYIPTCIDPYPNAACPANPQDPPSPWDVPPATTALPDITPPAAGFISENIGQVILPITSGANQTAACTIQGDYLPY